MEALEIAFHDERRESVFSRHVFLFMAGPACLDDVEMIDRRVLAGLRLDIMRRAVATRADRAVRRLLLDDVLSVHASLVGLVDVGMALHACRLGNGIDLAFRSD